MATILQLKRGTAAQVAAYEDAAVGELVLDTENNLLYVGQNDGSLERVDAPQITVDSTAPTNPANGDLWFDTNAGINILKRYDLATTSWVAHTYAATEISGLGAAIDTQLSTTTVTGIVLQNATIDGGTLS